MSEDYAQSIFLDQSWCGFSRLVKIAFVGLVRCRLLVSSAHLGSIYTCFPFECLFIKDIKQSLHPLKNSLETNQQFPVDYILLWCL